MAEDAAAPPTDFPVPPQQNTAWSLPEKVPDADGKLKAAVDAMFKLGLADPRGCAYHHVKVREGGKLQDARGWVLPAKEGDGERYAIGWNGLIYPVGEVGKAADLGADVAILTVQSEFQEEPFSNYSDESVGRVLSEFAASPRMMRAWAAPYLLLRLGADITIYGTSNAPVDPNDPFAEETPLSHLGKGYDAGLYLDSGHERLVQFAKLTRGDGVAAFVDKNDRLAANRLQTFDRVWEEVVHRMPHEEGEREVDPFSDTQESLRPKLNSGWRSLLADARRRLSPEKAVGDSEIDKEIATWDEVESWDIEENWQSDKSIPPASFERVVAAGSDAIRPLLACIENDPRWTRARWGGTENDGTGRIRPFVRVRDLAICALNRILRFKVVDVPYQADYDTPTEETWYVDAADRMKAVCGKYGNVCGGELWFRILADDGAETIDQLQAAQLIVEPMSLNSYGVPEGGGIWLRAPDARSSIECPKVSIEGNQLRSRRDPSVLDLMKRAWRRSMMRTDKAIAEGAAQTRMPMTCGGEFWSIYAETHAFVLLMEEWQHGNQEMLKEDYDWLATALGKMRKDGSNGDFMVRNHCEEILILRLWAGDESAMGDYETLFHESKSPRDVPVEVMRVVPEAPGMDRLAGEAFLGDQAPLGLVNKPWVRWDQRMDLIKYDSTWDGPSPLLVLPSVRRALIESLQSQARQGTLVVTENDCSVKFDADKDEPPSSGKPTLPGTGEVLRLCDVVADLITPKRGAAVWVSPRFRLQDPLADRDRAIAEWIGILSKP